MRYGVKQVLERTVTERDHVKQVLERIATSVIM